MTTPRILIVDDQPAISQVCHRMLQSGGLMSDQVSNGKTAIELLHAKPYDLVLLDVHMPEMSGPEVLQELRRNPPTPHIKVVLLSGDARSNEMAELLANGADDYLTKPVSSVELLCRVNAVLRLKEAQDRSDQLTQCLQDAYHDLENRVRDRTAELARVNAASEQLIASISSILIGIDAQGNVTKWNKRAEEMFGILTAAVLGLPFSEVAIRWKDETLVRRILDCRKWGVETRFRNLLFISAEGEQKCLEFSITPLIRQRADVLSGLLVLGEDLTERQLLEAQLAQAQKLESIGQLAAGVAHEINTPIQYVGDNTTFLRDSFRDLRKAMVQYHDFIEAYRNNSLSPARLELLDDCLKDTDLEYISAEIPNAIQQSLEGLDRVAQIVRALKEFSHPGSDEKSLLDINHAIENTLTVARNEWKYVARVVTDFDASMPLVSCLADQFNQVIINLIINAAHAIAATTGQESSKGTITVRTRQVSGFAEIQIADTGCGIPESIRSRVFDPFFTTKPVGKGTGQGLAIAHTIIVNTHSGSIRFESEVGKGTTFIVRLPLAAVSSVDIPG